MVVIIKGNVLTNKIDLTFIFIIRKEQYVFQHKSKTYFIQYNSYIKQLRFNYTYI